MKNFSMLILAISSGIVLYGQLVPQDAILLMGRGINLGNTLEPPDEGGWNNPKAEEYYFDDYVLAGFKTVRIPVSWYGHTSESMPYTIDNDWMNRIEEIVDWGLNRKLFIVLNAHHEGWLKEEPSKDNLQRFDSIWSQIAFRFKDKSDSLIFEILNEPYPMPKDTVDNLNERVLSIIRKTNPTRIVVFSGHMWSNAEELITTKIPNDDYLIGYFHSYDPWIFAGEANGTWGTRSDMNNLVSNFSKAKVWSETNDIPVMLSEFGAIKFCDYNSRMKHYAAYVEQAMEHNFTFNAWDDGDDFRIYQRLTRGWNEIKDILIDYSSRHPVYFNVLNNNGDEVELSWVNRLAECDSIFIHRGTDLSDFEKIAAVTADIDTYVDNSVERNKNYYYKVVSYRQDTVELYSYPQKVFTEYVSTIQKINDIPIRIYPNPANNTITIQLVNSFSECEISIVDATGKLRLTKIITSREENLDLGQLEQGIYILTLKLNNMEYSTEISKN